MDSWCVLSDSNNVIWTKQMDVCIHQHQFYHLVVNVVRVLSCLYDLINFMHLCASSPVRRCRTCERRYCLLDTAAACAMFDSVADFLLSYV